MDRLQFVEFMAFNALVGTPDTPVVEAVEAWMLDDSTPSAILYNAYVIVSGEQWAKIGKGVMWGLKKLNFLPEWEK